MNNYKQLHLELTRKLKDTTLYDFEVEAIRQRLYYIETEYEYKPRYSHEQLKRKPHASKASKPYKKK